MIALAFVGLVVGLFAIVFACEAPPGTPGLAARPAGLWRWLTAGNWTAKLGGVLLAIGVGALLRYLLLNIDLPANVKLSAGILIATALGIGAAFVGPDPQRRAVRLALAGASLGVAYLTAYSAYGFFGYVSDVQGLGLLFVVACVATVYAVATRALSIAVLAMIGAYLAPAFALRDTGPLPVYGYYVAASIVTLAMVWLRGWRALIHLSFLFTLAGALFFAWTRGFYTPTHYAQMQPLLLALVGIHLLMPLVEARGTADPDGGPGHWLRRFDVAYFLLLPAVALTLTLVLAPDTATDGALGVLALALLWLGAAGLQHARFGSGAVRYACVALCLAAAAGLLALGDLPVLLSGTVVLCLLVTFATPLGLSDATRRLAVSLALASATCYLLQALSDPVAGTPFLNAPFARHALVGLSLALAGWSLRRSGERFGTVFVTYAGAWLFTSGAREILRLHLQYLPQLCHLLALAATLAYALAVRLSPRRPSLATTLLLAGTLFFTALVSASGFGAGLLLPMMLAGQLGVLLLAHTLDRREDDGPSLAAVARSLLPVVLFPWAVRFAQGYTHGQADAVLTLLVASALVASLVAQWTTPRRSTWPTALSPVGFVLFAVFLLFETTCHIEREPWAVAFELLAMVYLAETARFLAVTGNRDARFFGGVAVLGIGAVGAAMLLRVIGPPGTLTILDLNDLLVPAVVSLLLALVGALLTWLSTRSHSRGQWSLGATLLVLAAAKLILADFGSLGQLANILAMIAAGLVFLAVAWLAPFPPKAELPPTAPVGHRTGAPAAPASGTGAPAASTTATGAGPSGTASAAPPPRQPGRPATPVIPDSDPGASRGWIWVVCGLALILMYGYDQQSDYMRTTRMASQARARMSPPPDGQRVPLSPGATRTPRPLAAEPPALSCERFVGRLPDDYLVYAVGDDRAPDTASGTEPAHGVPEIPVTVDEPAHPVVLALSSPGPVAWRVGRGAYTRIAGVIVSGGHRSRVLGVGPDTAILYSTDDDGAPCGSFQVDRDHPQGANVWVSKLLVHAVDGYFLATGGRVVIGANPAPGAAVTRGATAATALEILHATYASPRNRVQIDVTGKVRSLCRGSDGHCAIRCGNELAGDPDFGQRKTCSISFRCDGEHTSVMQADEDARLVMDCR